MRNIGYVIALVLLSSCLSSAQSAITHRTLRFTTFVDTFVPGDGSCPNCTVAAYCTTSGCTASARLFPGWHVTCPVAAGRTCTFALQANNAFWSTPGDAPFIDCKVDGQVLCQYFTIPGSNMINTVNMTFLVAVK